jgi:hypothetical protein
MPFRANKLTVYHDFLEIQLCHHNLFWYHFFDVAFEFLRTTMISRDIFTSYPDPLLDLKI